MMVLWQHLYGRCLPGQWVQHESLVALAQNSAQDGRPGGQERGTGHECPQLQQQEYPPLMGQHVDLKHRTIKA